MMPVLSQKMINVLKVLDGGKPIIAVWKNPELSALERMGFAISSYAVSPNGRSHSSKVWAITLDGRMFLVDERGGQ